MNSQIVGMPGGPGFEFWSSFTRRISGVVVRISTKTKGERIYPEQFWSKGSKVNRF